MVQEKINLVTLLTVACLISSCSYFKRKNVETYNDLGETDKSGQYVEKSKYDELLMKYESVLHNRDVSQKQREIESSKDLSSSVDVRSESIKSEIKSVDKYLSMASKTPKNLGKKDSVRIFQESELFRKAIGLMSNDKFGPSMTILQKLEKSKYAQIRVRAKYHIGELLHRQNEYDLALQIFEEIIEHYAFSGFVVKAIQKSVLCAKKLGLDKKHKKFLALEKRIFRKSG
ncbi:hypothetical protein OAB57_01295 [Bacteriovoracaceae bacterium]|nr:hypothetical protein [Bacteriovoracaceae bacterium]